MKLVSTTEAELEVHIRGSVEGADHNLAVTHPEQLAIAITDFIARHPMTRS